MEKEERYVIKEKEVGCSPLP